MVGPSFLRNFLPRSRAKVRLLEVHLSPLEFEVRAKGFHQNKPSMSSHSINKILLARYARQGIAASAISLTGLASCNQSQKSNPSPEGEAMQTMQVKLTDEKECCFGLNECRGQGGCAVPENHDCAGKNECKGRGGCNMHCPK